MIHLKYLNSVFQELPAKAVTYITMTKHSKKRRGNMKMTIHFIHAAYWVSQELSWSGYKDDFFFGWCQKELWSCNFEKFISVPVLIVWLKAQMKFKWGFWRKRVGAYVSSVIFFCVFIHTCDAWERAAGDNLWQKQGDFKSRNCFDKLY